MRYLFMFFNLLAILPNFSEATAASYLAQEKDADIDDDDEDAVEEDTAPDDDVIIMEEDED